MSQGPNLARHGLEVFVGKLLPSDVVAAVDRGLAEHARLAGVSSRVEVPLSVAARSSDGSLVGALLGRTVWGWLHVKELWVAPNHRGQGLGRRLVQAAEQAALAQGCHSAYLDTFDFQALPFYLRMGYTQFGELDAFPQGHKRHFLQKRLVA
jgi:GNAT superfamily N-acetyltransferase